MQDLTGREHVHTVINRRQVERIGVFEHFWGDGQYV